MSLLRHVRLSLIREVDGLIDGGEKCPYSSLEIQGIRSN
jgi:hypothetical protein